MPYKIEKRSGARPWKIIANGTVVGSCLNKKNCQASVRAREAAERKAKK
jgi:hypothetical protein